MEKCLLVSTLHQILCWNKPSWTHPYGTLNSNKGKYMSNFIYVKCYERKVWSL